ncbi:MAG: hypothetical protein DWB56_07975 [Candidatus Jettenia sp.]|uniref:Uncharacterized protein n=1 Tax=Candidatus Jettenia caeni TaxID=247490 RepID=I3IJD3_9BACT|nr:hypothetical protein [Candidatus Jettenia sp. AMX1]MBC6928883.1 hypothetical protein [Candidatus Jettenia sp.]GAB61828.1 hypothetical protein KSU1_C0232 [Candidatus Jettenia caeni]KAA0250873.1 MAG: hypothetical protein EDM77_03440 [Candidatus Jettenia sp. AMX1]MCE7879884.1 hypothetical protein [Candidatus Jettenia sp. AMX1]MCQ3926663.1 hypothetical protein [Candidatus Jettenia sp.]
MTHQKEHITPEVFQQGIHELFVCCKDPRSNRNDIDRAIFEGASLMCATLRQLGYQEGIDTFEMMCMTIPPPSNFVTTFN